MTEPPTPAEPKRIAVLASGEGSTLQAIIDACRDGQLRASLVGVFSDHPSARALHRAQAAGIPATGLSPRDFPTRLAFDRTLFEAVEATRPDLIVLAGYLRVIAAEIVRPRIPRMINLHPSLLPKHPGLNTHARALAAGDCAHGASVHVVTPELDAGPVLAQVRLPVHRDDTAATLEQRVKAREKPLLIASLDLLIDGRLVASADGGHLDGVRLSAPLLLNDSNRLVTAP